MSKRKLLTTAMAAKQLGFTADWVRKLIIDGKIKAEKLGHDWLIKEQDIKNVSRKRWTQNPNKKV